ncbi:N-acetylmuramoyl-L-alanine amidase family protein [Tumebacillus lipolyticus]|uniref:N-acetylmuramoyl-L-alanine amidase n=1 Tax=Tumebacillus lipolyticus TaxID=1280370 RepID=A0ABW5A3M9_9BACL
MSKLIVIDPGHGGTDPGAVGNGQKEKDATLAFSRMVGAHLARSGLRVEYTRTTDTFVGLSERAAFANRLRADYFTSFHLNSNSGAPGTGFESYVQIGCTGGETDRKRKIVHRQMAEVAARYGLHDRGCKSGDLAVTRETVMDAALFELLFINHPADALLLANKSFMAEMSESSARGICEALGVLYKPPTSTLDPVSAKLAIALYGSITQTSSDEITVACNYAANALRREVGLPITTDLGKPTSKAADIIIRATGTMWEGARTAEVGECFHFAAEALRAEK